MLVFAGLKRMVRQLGTVFMLCSFCQRPCAHPVRQVRTWFTLFFVPVVPLSTKYFTVCTLCARTARATRDEADRMVAAGQVQRGAPSGAARVRQATAPGTRTPPAPRAPKGGIEPAPPPA